MVLEAERLPALPGRSRPPRRASEPAATSATATSRRPLSTAGPATELTLALGFDPQTAGGLLVSLPEDRAPVLEATFAAARALPGADRPGRGGLGGGARVMEAATSRLSRARSRARSVSPSAFRRLAAVALGSLFVVVATGAIVRLTASGLGCDNWPRCGDTPFPEKDFHALVEFGNRVVALGAMACTTSRRSRRAGWPHAAGRLRVGRRRASRPPSWPRSRSAGLTVIFDLHPLIVMWHFLLAFGAVALATCVLVGADGFAKGRPVGTLPAWLPWLALAILPAALVLVVTGAFVTAAGPHSGG